MVYHRSSSEPSSQRSRPVNAFANDGSFMEMFKKMQEQQQVVQSGESSATDGNKRKADSSVTVKESAPAEEKEKSYESSSSGSKPTPPVCVGKRRGGRFLATGKVKKLKSAGDEAAEAPPKDAWSLYLAEVKKYKQTTCEEEGKTRPLVK